MLQDELKMTVKLTLPKGWRSGPTERLLGVFVDSYLKKHPDAAMDGANMHFVKKGGIEVAMDAPCTSVLENGDDLYLKHGAGKTMKELGFTPSPPLPSSSAPSPSTRTSEKEKVTVSSVKQAQAAADAKLEAKRTREDSNANGTEKGEVCKRFGCKKHFDPEDERAEGECRYHEKPPVFHETKKFWSCCPDKVAWDWDSFEEIPGCCTGKHSLEKPGDTMFLGGTDMRAAAAAEGPITTGGTPERLNLSSLEKLSSLRKSLVTLGVPGVAFDRKRDELKAQVEEERKDNPEQIWDMVAQKFAEYITRTSFS